MKVFIKNLKIKDTKELSLVTVFEFLYNGIPSSISGNDRDDYEVFYADLIEKYKEIPDNDVIFPEDSLHIGLITKILWDSGIKTNSDIDLHEPPQFRKGPYCSRFDILIDSSSDIIDDLIVELDKYYTYDRS